VDTTWELFFALFEFELKLGMFGKLKNMRSRNEKIAIKEGKVKHALSFFDLRC